MKKKNNFDIRQLKVPLILLIVFWVIAIIFWQLKENIFFLFNFGYIGTSIGRWLRDLSIPPKEEKALGTAAGPDFGWDLHAGLFRDHHDRKHADRRFLRISFGWYLFGIYDPLFGGQTGWPSDF